jgi:hypothetical protein
LTIEHEMEGAGTRSRCGVKKPATACNANIVPVHLLSNEQIDDRRSASNGRLDDMQDPQAAGLSGSSRWQG